MMDMEKWTEQIENNLNGVSLNLEEERQWDYSNEKRAILMISGKMSREHSMEPSNPLNWSFRFAGAMHLARMLHSSNPKK